MTRDNHPFQARSGNDLQRLVAEQPMGWIVSGAGDSFRASLMPFRPWRTENGRILQFASHLPRSNDQVPFLRDRPEANLLFLGPNHYISPSWVSDRRWAPTWNFASAAVRVEIEFRDDPKFLRAMLEDLVDGMEAGRDNAWRLEEMGKRYAELSRRIIGFVAHVCETNERYKLGQDERPEVFSEILQGLEACRHDDLKAWMEYFNMDRGD